MYIHRIVIDANQINARGRIAGMNYLEELHNANLVEIFRTSTLASEFINKYAMGQRKAESFATIGGVQAYLPGSQFADSMWGSSRESRVVEWQNIAFGPRIPSNNDLRDALHLDQAYLHDADYFVTDDGKLLASAQKLLAAGFPSSVCTAEQCVESINAYFVKHYQTKDIGALVSRLADAGPILLGSNSIGGFAIEQNEEAIFGVAFNSGIAEVSANIRTRTGQLTLSISPRTPFVFHNPESSFFGCRVASPVLIGEETHSHFEVMLRGDPDPVLAGRVLKSKRLLVVRAKLSDSSGRVVVEVAKGSLRLLGAGLRLQS